MSTEEIKRIVREAVPEIIGGLVVAAILGLVAWLVAYRERLWNFLTGVATLAVGHWVYVAIVVGVLGVLMWVAYSRWLIKVARQRDKTVISIQPATQTVKVGDAVAVEVHVRNVSSLFGADLRIDFDPRVVRVVDCNSLAPGNQIVPGAFLDISAGKGFTVENQADNAVGTIRYAATLLSPTRPVSGEGPLLSIKLEGMAQGESPVTIKHALLSDPQSRPIAAVTRSGLIRVTDGMTSLNVIRALIDGIRK